MTGARESMDITDRVNALNQSICNLQLQQSSPYSPYRHKVLRKSSRFGLSERSISDQKIEVLATQHNTDESRRNHDLYQESLIEMAESVRFQSGDKEESDADYTPLR